MDYRQAIEWLYEARLRGVKLGLENTRRLLEALGHPDRAYRVLHVAGTNGKGSTCAMMASICRAAGLHVGLFTSPHLVHFCERIRIDHEMVTEQEVAEGLTRIRQACQNFETPPTFFEIATVLALDCFRTRGVEVAVLETGMGGRLDASNACQPDACAITPIGLDHMRWLGNTHAEIAAEKAGIIKPGVPIVCAPQVPEAEKVIRARAAVVGAPFLQVNTPWHRTPRSLPGTHQRWNAATAIATCAAAGITLPEQELQAALDATEWPGRFQRVGEWLVLDGAHNEASARVLADTWREVFADLAPTLILGVVADKDVHAICRPLAPLASHAIATCPPSERALPADALASEILKANPHLSVQVIPDPKAALESARHQGRMTLAAGSLFLVGALLAHLHSSPTTTPQPNDP